MEVHEQSMEETLFKTVLRFNAKVVGTVTGLLAGGAVFVATNWLLIKGGENVGAHLILLNQFFLGYQVSLLGSFIGGAYGFICGFLIGYFHAWTYNRILRRKSGVESAKGSAPR